MKSVKNLRSYLLTSSSLLAVASTHAAEWNLNNNGNWNANGNWVNPATFPNAIDAVADFSKLDITANRTISVNEAITIGSLLLGDSVSNQTYTLAPGTAGTLTFDVSSGNASITKTSGGTDAITTSVTMSDGMAITVNTGQLNITGGLNNGGNLLTVNGSGNTSFAGTANIITGSGGITKNGSGTLFLGAGGTTPAHNFTGPVIINGGTVMTFGNTNKSSANYTLNGGMLTDYYRSTTTFTGGLGTDNNQIQIYGNSGFGGGNGTSSWRIGAQNSVLTWGTAGENGNINATGFFNPTALKFLTPVDNMGPSIYGQVAFQNGLDLNGGARTIEVREATGANAFNSSWARITGVISGTTGSLVKTGGGNLRLQGANTYGGGTTINAGSIFMENASALGSTSGALTVNSGGTLNLNDQNLSVGNLTGTGGTIINNGANARTLTIGTGNNGGGNFQGVIANNNNAGAGTISLTKTGTGSITLSGVNTYSGATLISQGSLTIGGTGSINNSAVTLDGGTFVYNSSVTHTNTFNFISGTLGGTNLNGSLGGQTIGEGQTISPGNSPGTAATTSQTWAGGGDYLWEINNATGTAGADPGWDLINGSGNLDITALSGDPFTILVTSLTPSNTSGVVDNFDDLTSYEWLIADFASITGFSEDSFDIDTSDFLNPFTGEFGISQGGVGIVPGDNSQIYLTYTAAPVAIIPEPTTALLSVLGLLALLRRKR